MSNYTTFIEISNEPFKNLPGGGVRAHALGKKWQGRFPNLLIASGAGDGDIAAGDFAALAAMTLDYCTTHDHARGHEWPRKMKDALEIRWGLTGQILDVPVVMDEPIGAAEVAEPGRRSATPEDFAWGAAVLALQGPGGTFHSSDGIESRPFGPTTKRCAEEWTAAMRWAGPNAQAWTYSAGHLASCPIEHDDAWSLRTFAQISGGMAQVVVVRPTPAWTLRPKPGWTVLGTQGPGGTLISVGA